MTLDVEIGDEWTIDVNNGHRTLAAIGACGRQHECFVSLVLAGPTPGPVVRRQERLRHSADWSIIRYAELAEWCPMTTRHLVTRVKQQRLPDSYESQTCDLGLPNRRMAPHTKVPPRHERAHEGTKDVQGSGAQKPPRRGAHVPHVLCAETNRIRRTRRWLWPWKAP